MEAGPTFSQGRRLESGVYVGKVSTARFYDFILSDPRPDNHGGLQSQQCRNRFILSIFLKTTAHAVASASPVTIRKFYRMRKKELKSNATMYFKVARWFVFKPKIPIWVTLGGP
jgi:hypothetical protein